MSSDMADVRDAHPHRRLTEQGAHRRRVGKRALGVHAGMNLL
jgi:hypothetical protein